MRVASFDVFDTVLMRAHAASVDLFVELGRELGARGATRLGPLEFARQRVDAELAARKLSAWPEVTLGEIYEELTRRLQWNAEANAAGQAAELEIEKQSLRAVPGLKRRLVAARAAGERVVFVSDMYLPTDFIRRVLEREGLWQPGDGLFVSAEERVTKASGALFERVRERLGVGVGEWVHYGDNEWSDVRVPRERGIEARVVTEARLTRYEREARGGAEIAAEWRSKLAGTMRRTRLECGETEERLRVVWETACGVVGPLWFAYVRWCLEEAQRRGLRRLYFVARDGQVLCRVGKVVSAAWGYGIECRYLHGSRQAWHPAALVRVTRADFEWVLAATAGLTVRQVLERVGCVPEDLAGELGRAGFQATEWDAPLDAVGRGRLGECLLGDAVAAVVGPVATERRGLLLRYLEQEGFFDGTAAGLVDIGWFGNLQRSLRRVLVAGGRGETARWTGFYFGLVKGDRQSEEGEWVGFWPGRGGGEGGIGRENLAMFEVFAAADHGSVMGYREVGGRVEPVLREARNGVALGWGVDVLQAGVVRWTENLVAALGRGEVPGGEMGAVARGLFQRFYRVPSRGEAEVWGRVRFSDGQVETGFQEFVPQWTGWNAWRALFFGGGRPAYAWLEGALAVRPCLALRLYLALRRIRRRVSR